MTKIKLYNNIYPMIDELVNVLYNDKINNLIYDIVDKTEFLVFLIMYFNCYFTDLNKFDIKKHLIENSNKFNMLEFKSTLQIENKSVQKYVPESNKEIVNELVDVLYDDELNNFINIKCKVTDDKRVFVMFSIPSRASSSSLRSQITHC